MEEDNQTSKFLSECNLSLLQLRLFTSDYYKYPTCTSQSTLCFPIICQKYLQYSHQFNVLDMHIALSTKRMSHHVRYKNKYQFLHRERNEQKEPLCHNAYAKITNASILICRYTWVQGVACATSRSFFWKKWLSLKKGGGGTLDIFEDEVNDDGVDRLSCFPKYILVNASTSNQLQCIRELLSHIILLDLSTSCRY